MTQLVHPEEPGYEKNPEGHAVHEADPMILGKYSQCQEGGLGVTKVK